MASMMTCKMHSLGIDILYDMHATSSAFPLVNLHPMLYR